MPRLFVAVWPPPEVVEALRALPRPEVEGVRWTTEDQWHVTLRFLGAVPDGDVAPLTVALAAAAASLGPVEATLGPACRRFGRVVALPADGLDGVAGPVIDGTAAFGPAPERRRFRAHLTLARLRDPRRSRGVAWPALRAQWTVAAIALVRSHLGAGEGGRARYETVGTYPLGAED